MSGRFSGRTIVVTGGAGGLGAAMVAEFVAEGGQVVIADLDAARGHELAAEFGTSAQFAALDVAIEASWEGLLDRVDQYFGGLDVLVNNAGYFQPNIAFEDMTLDLWQKHFAINSDGVFLGCKHAIRRMKTRRSGSIVNIGSGLSITASPTASAYCASKAAVLMTTRTAAAAAGRYGIRVNAVLPGAVKTAMLMGNLVPGQTEAALLDGLAARTPLGAMATPADIARGVLFLADPANVAVTGIYLPVDCGDMPGA